MPARTNATASTAGVLRPEEFARHVHLERGAAGSAVAPWVENHWALRWSLPEGRHFASEVLPHPTCSLTVEVGSHRRPDLPPGEDVVVTGVCTRRFDVDVRGHGVVLGVRFRPGGLTALTGVGAAGWVDRSVPAREVLPADLVAALADAALVDDPGAWARALEDGLVGLGAGEDPRHAELLEVVGVMLADRSLLTVADVATRVATTPRSLQRLFTHYVGVGPKWVLARYRMHDVVSELDAGYDGTLTDLAHRYGWYDQAHFTRDFTALVGVSPGRYRARR
ncbi:MAG: helix-turn-helix transcriptional regulator [Micrococcales bacterium]|nr:helix-turn-helix transcriptional regulator [Micrococcales bacterium]